MQCFVHLNDPLLAAELLKNLLSSGIEDALLTAYQIAFDLADTASQEFLGVVRESLGTGHSGSNGNDAEAMETDGPSQTTEEAPSTVNGSSSAIAPEILSKVQSILTGHESIKLSLEFLYTHAKTDLQILTKTKESLEARNSIDHNAVTFNNAFVNAGTCSDQFLRDNLDWLAKASNWSKFSATAALGVIHRGNLEYGMSLLQPYLPGEGSGGPGASVYSEGGALFALGLVHANNAAAGGKAKEALQFLRTSLKAEGGEVVQHGAALGLGVAAMATGNEGEYCLCDVRMVCDYEN